ncbi:MAG: DAK2 domain-containing protein [Clostridia bacterium]|nr:DAK2 domain-containing protein [Clostridia bacterium]
MLRNGLAALQEREMEINGLNVFPVPDGDTGTNMAKTLENGIAYAESRENVGAYLKGLSNGMLLGARGNSGVILSQFFKGFYLELSRAALLGPGELRNGLIRAYRTAYASVVQPVEGTILTVTREGIENIRRQITRNVGVDTLLAMYIAEMRKSLAYTPELLPVLKEAGVVDSGAKGFIIIVEGMLRYLRGEVITPNETAKQPEKPAVDFRAFNENSVFEDGYCMEFILQLMNSPQYAQDFSLKRYIRTLETRGESIVAVQDERRVKVHIHTKTPAPIITLSQRFGEFLTFKLENMQIQHNEHDGQNRQAVPHKALAIVAVADGDGLGTIFSDFGCDVVLPGGPSNCTPAEAFVQAFKQLNADRIVVLPNDKNIIPAAEQAAELYGGAVTVLPTKTMMQGYFALAMDLQDSDDVDRRIGQMQASIQNVVVLQSATASRAYTYHEFHCEKGEEIVLTGGEITCVDADRTGAILGALAMVEEIDDKDTCILFRGADVLEEDAEALAEAIAAAHPMMEAQVLYGGQDIYHYIIGIV